ncbi:MAG TPA: lysoplasmalogenase [Microbacterium sp.]|uniref:lysoplasmalogenase n=1 Tax=Microbacterium sp. TaxID=51671 RepID=UPI002B47C9AF|nr:lysoplasmalogenase [Microbacterium sp.]HKT55920.1 lysoplasmalogenase [Microbacterium sp.]
MPHRARWWAFAPSVVVTLWHLETLLPGIAHSDAAEVVSKLLLMPALAVGVLAVWRGPRRMRFGLLLAALFFSWLGDEAGVFFRMLPEVPTMVGFFALAHIGYIWLFTRHLKQRRLPWWTLVFAVWWVAMIGVLWPRLGSLAIPMAVYGLILGSMATTAAATTPLIAAGGAVFLLSDSMLAFQLFPPTPLGAWSDLAVMTAYCLGQLLIAVGVVLAPAHRRTRVDTPVAA